MISFISSFEIIKVVVEDLKILFWIAASVADGSTVNPNGTKTFLGNGVSTIFINSKAALVDGPRKLNNRPS